MSDLPAIELTLTEAAQLMDLLTSVTAHTRLGCCPQHDDIKRTACHFSDLLNYRIGWTEGTRGQRPESRT